MAGESDPEAVAANNDGALPTGVEVLELFGLWNKFNPTKSLLDLPILNCDVEYKSIDAFLRA